MQRAKQAFEFDTEVVSSQSSVFSKEGMNHQQT